MPRFLPIALCAALLAAPAPAAAKELQGAKICGPDACTEVPEEELSIHLVEGGTASPGPERPEPFYRVRLTVGAEGVNESWWIVVLPRGGYTGFPDGPGPDYEWATIDGSAAATYRRLAGDLRPFEADELRQPRDAPAAETAAPSAPPTDDEAGGQGVAVAGAVAGALLLVAAAFSLWRRRGVG